MPSTFLIAHTNPDGKTGIACKTINAMSQMGAVKAFNKLHPQRVITTVNKKES